MDRQKIDRVVALTKKLHKAAKGQRVSITVYADVPTIQFLGSPEGMDMIEPDRTKWIGEYVTYEGKTTPSWHYHVMRDGVKYLVLMPEQIKPPEPEIDVPGTDKIDC